MFPAKRERSAMRMPLYASELGTERPAVRLEAVEMAVPFHAQGCPSISEAREMAEMVLWECHLT
jgi:hypothetical protein